MVVALVCCWSLGGNPIAAALCGTGRVGRGATTGVKAPPGRRSESHRRVPHPCSSSDRGGWCHHPAVPVPTPIMAPIASGTVRPLMRGDRSLSSGMMQPLMRGDRSLSSSPWSRVGVPGVHHQKGWPPPRAAHPLRPNRRCPLPKPTKALRYSLFCSLSNPSRLLHPRR